MAEAASNPHVAALANVAYDEIDTPEALAREAKQKARFPHNTHSSLVINLSVADDGWSMVTLPLRGFSGKRSVLARTWTLRRGAEALQ